LRQAGESKEKVSQIDGAWVVFPRFEMGSLLFWVCFVALLAATCRLAWMGRCGHRLQERAPVYHAPAWIWVLVFLVILEISQFFTGKWGFLLMTAGGGFWLWQRFGMNWRDAVGWNADVLWKTAVFGAWWGMALALPQHLGSWTNTVVCEWMGWPVEESALLRRLLESTDPWEIGWIVLLVCGIAPVAEEIVYRGFLWSALRAHCSGAIATWISALIFATLHWQIDSFLAHLVAGVTLGEIWRRTGSLPLCIVVHGMVNAVTVISILLHKWGGL
jgi:membrane protease YdiL (CAAX protease family)